MKKPLIILEVANNHMGDLNHFRNIIKTYHKLTLKYKKNMDFASNFNLEI